MTPNFYVHCCIIGWYSKSLRKNVSIYLNKTFQFRHTFKGGGGLSTLEHLNLNDDAEFDSKISYIMFFK